MKPSLLKIFLPSTVAILLTAFALRTTELSNYPYGPQYDEAVYLLLSRDVAFHGVLHFPIVNAYQGREMLYMYLAAPLLRFVIDDVYALRLTSVFCNLLTIAATIMLGRVMFRGPRGLAVGLIAGVLATLSFPQILLARQAFRAVSLPLMQALALALLWQGLTVQRGERRWLIAAGFFSGVVLYTYMASRLFPVWLGLAGALLLLLDRRQLRRLLLFAGVFNLTVLPMLIFAVQNPDVFLGRLSEVTSSTQSLTLWESILVHARMFFIQGEWLLRYNIPLRPYFTLAEGGMLLIGLALALRLVVHRDAPPLERTAAFLLLLSPLMVIPSVISVGGYPPNFMRSLGMVPLIFLLVALGFEAVQRRLRIPLVPSLLIVLLGGAVWVGQEYFAWARTPELYTQNDRDMAEAARWVNSQNQSFSVYIAAQDRDHPTFTVYHPAPVTWLGSDSLFRPPPGQTGLYMFTHTAPPDSRWQSWLSSGLVDDVPLAPDGSPAFAAYRVRGDQRLPVSTPPPEPVENVYLRLIGALLPDISADHIIQGEFQWEILRAIPTADLMPVLTIDDPTGSTIFRSDVNTSGTDQWQVGAVLIQRMDLSVPAGTPPGLYPVYVEWWSPSTQVILHHQTERGEIHQRALAGYVTVTRPEQFPDPDAFDMLVQGNHRLTDAITLLGWSLPDTLRPGEDLRLELLWHAQDAPFQDYLLHVQLRSNSGVVIPLGSTLPVATYPTSAWTTGETLRAPVVFPTDRELTEGTYSVDIRLADRVVMLGTLEVSGIARVFSAPAVGTRVNAELGGVIRLLGYNIEQGDTLQLELVWESLSPTPTDYTVFVHVLDSEGTIVTQRDVMPVNYTYPTSLWVAGEFVSDPHGFTGLPAGSYTVRVGMYLQRTQERLLLVSGENCIEFTVEIPQRGDQSRSP